jgi:replication fork clamp-binding protein CrfC
MARELDPKGIRTIGVVTKIDIMDSGTNAKRMLEGKDVSLRLGFIGIKNRSQQDIIDRISVEAAIEKEQLYFSTYFLIDVKVDEDFVHAYQAQFARYHEGN